MQQIESLTKHGLFDAKVPRYTSYPPANHFGMGIGGQFQKEWLSAVPEGSEISVYIHIPFCKRLCWFCACRTQGTKTMRPVDAYVKILRQEITAARAVLPQNLRMGRLHLGGGTPTILPPKTMTALLDTVFEEFTPAEDFEFSVEIDPTEAKEELLDVLIAYGMNRASIGVQDFEPKIQEAIGRPQSLEITQKAVDYLRKNGVKSLNMDLLYGLPYQTEETFAQTMKHVLAMRPDRLAIYGYAHVPWMSKRQVMIPEETLPGRFDRYALAEQAFETFVGNGYEAVGIDHFALPSDGLAQATMRGALRRNFQGYTDDSCPTLVGFGASAISRFEQGYVQNATATSAYQERILETGLAGHKGYNMSPDDTLIARMVEDLMCHFALDRDSLCRDFPLNADFITMTIARLEQDYSDVFFTSDKGLELHAFAKPLVRVIAHQIDNFASAAESHSSAI